MIDSKNIIEELKDDHLKLKKDNQKFQSSTDSKFGESNSNLRKLKSTEDSDISNIDKINSNQDQRLSKLNKNDQNHKIKEQELQQSLNIQSEQAYKVKS